MTNELEKQFFDTFGIECNISYHQQYNGAQIPRGLEFYKEREKLAETGMIKIWHKMLNPRPENYCVYWGEYHYPQITDRILLGIIAKIMWSYSCTQNDFDAYEVHTVDNLKEAVLKHAIELSKNDAYVYWGVRTLFEEG